MPESETVLFNENRATGCYLLVFNILSRPNVGEVYRRSIKVLSQVFRGHDFDLNVVWKSDYILVICALVICVRQHIHQ